MRKNEIIIDDLKETSIALSTTEQIIIKGGIGVEEIVGGIIGTDEILEG